MKILLAIALLVTPAMAQGSSPTISVATGGGCVCGANGKTWPCRQAVDYTKVLTCNAVAIAKLTCPEDKNEVCTYSLQSTCPASPMISVCYAGDEPK